MENVNEGNVAGYFSPVTVSLSLACLQQLESVCWESGGEVLVSSHSDGTYAVWAVDDTSPCTQQPVSSVTPYGEPHISPSAPHISPSAAQISPRAPHKNSEC